MAAYASVFLNYSFFSSPDLEPSPGGGNKQVKTLICHMFIVAAAIKMGMAYSSIVQSMPLALYLPLDFINWIVNITVQIHFLKFIRRFEDEWLF